jgi:hypothetical protein
MQESTIIIKARSSLVLDSGNRCSEKLLDLVIELIEFADALEKQLMLTTQYIISAFIHNIIIGGTSYNQEFQISQLPNLDRLLTPDHR